jgi:PAS domain S-box-containing protein
MRRHAAPSPFLAGADEHSVFRSLFAAYPDAMIVVGADGTIAMANPAAEALLGYSADELAGLSVDALVPDSVRPRHAAHRGAYAVNPRPRPMGTQMDLVAKRKDGSEVMVEISLSPLQDHGLPFVVASIRDIGSYPRVKQALQRARYSEHLALLGRAAVDERDPAVLLEQAPRLAAEALQLRTALVSLLEDDRQSFRIASGVGLLPQQAVGQRVPNTPDTLPGYLMEHGEPLVLPDYRAERRFALPGHLVEAGFTCGVVIPLTDRGRTFGTLAVHAERPQAFGEDELRFLESLCSLLATGLQRAQTEEALRHSQRLESVGQLTGGIAHDFNNLLTVIQGNLQILEDTAAVATDAHAQRLVNAATRATRRAAELTGKLLAFSRRQVLQPAAVDVGAMLQSLADMLRRTLDQRVRIEIEVEPGCPAVLVDPVQLESALLNIAINARDAMPEGGHLRFRAAAAARLPGDADRDAAPGGEPAGFVSIAISDTGTGMPDEVLERAFEPFFTTKEAGRGTGLGLSTVYGFAKQSHGTVDIASAPGAGTTVTLHLPRLRDAAGLAAEETPADELVPAALEILLVEDDAAVRAVALAFLDGFGARVTPCATAEEALLVLGTGARFDLLLTDIALGAGMRGTELAGRAQALLPGLAVLLVSGFPAELIDADGSAPPNWELLPKPYARGELARAIVSALRQAPGADR